MQENLIATKVRKMKLSSHNKTRRLQNLATDLPLQEQWLFNQSKAAAVESYSMDAKYAIISIHQLFQLVQQVREGCKQCVGIEHSNIRFTEYQMSGHAMLLHWTCQTCGTSNKWNSSMLYGDNSEEVNKDMTCAWFITGGEHEHYQEFTAALRCGTYSKYHKALNQLKPIILEQEDKMYRENINSSNETPGTILGFDCQHSRSQRSFGPAPFATTTFINHNLGSKNYGKILYQSHIGKHQLKEMELKQNNSKDKLTTDTGLQKMAVELNCIVGGICDGSSSGNKSWNTIIAKNDKHKQAILSNCFWHRSTSY